ncbi:MAG: cytochrome P450 [Alphaproteobacteria bacterium]|nr:cytochrome P450 [Alphaproteobacteria bacterium]MBV8408814.1 cytochrome P450 [Alphaproteobacteria bacterium]
MQHPVSDLDPFSKAYFDDPYPAQDRLREAGDAVWLSRYGVWATARFQHVRAMLFDWKTFCSSRGVGLSDFAKEAPWRPRSIVLEVDPPVHGRARGVLNRVLSPAAMKRLEARFAAAADTLVDELLERQHFDAIADLAEAYPLSVFPDALGMPRENRDYLLPYGNMVFNAFGPRNAFFDKAVENAAPVLDWLGKQMRRDALAPEGFGAEIHAAVDTGELTAEEAPLVVRSLLTAGVDTTVNGLGAALYCLARYPDQWQALRADPSLAKAAFEEAVRFESPVQTFFRTTTRDARIGEVEIQEGQKVLMFLGAANRDPRQWENPEIYDIRRKTIGHVGFGAGIHMCVGQMLARLEGEVVLAALARKVASIDIVGTPQRRYNNTLRGLSSLPVEIRAA